MRFLHSALLLVLFFASTSPAFAQGDEPSLGDLARTVRKNKPQQPAHPVIDNENLAQALENVKSIKASELVFSVDNSGKGFKVSSDDVTCSLSFNARSASLLIMPVVVENVPPTELLKVDGPASIQDDTLQIEVFNGTEWELREITIGLTLERKPGENAEVAASARVIPATQGIGPAVIERHSDVTVLYHLKGTAKPFSSTTLRENIGVTPAPDQEWRWSIVEAKGIRPTDSQIPQEPQLPPDSLPSSPQLPLAPVVPPQPSR